MNPEKRHTIFLTLIILLLSCSFSILNSYKNENCGSILYKFNVLDSLASFYSSEYEYYDSLEVVNDKIFKLISSLTLDSNALHCVISKLESPQVAYSSNREFILFSWDTHQGGTMIDYCTATIFKDDLGSGYQAKMLIDTTRSNQNTQTYFNQMFQLEVDNETYYLAKGSGMASSSLPWSALQCFKINNGDIIDIVNLFENISSSLIVWFDLTQFRDRDKFPYIEIKNGGNVLFVPKVNEGVPTDSVIKYEFNGKYYAKTDSLILTK